MNRLTAQFPGRDHLSAGQQAGHQAAALVVSLAMSIVGGLVTGPLSVSYSVIQTHKGQFTP